MSRTTTWTLVELLSFPYLGDLPERVGSNSDHVLAAPVANVPQRGDLDLSPGGTTGV